MSLTNSLNAAERSDVGGVPRVPQGFMVRSRLTTALETASDCPLLVVRASGGSGKSGLIAAWLRQEKHHSASSHLRRVWVSLDEGSRSRSSFWRRVVRSFEPTGQILQDSALANFALGNADLNDVPGYFLEHLERQREPILLVLDDFHLVDDTNAADIIWLLKRTEWLRVIVTTRRRGGFERVEVAAQLASLTITEDDLLFTKEETRSLLSETTEFELGYAEIVHAATGGHPLATRIATTLLTQRPDTIVADASDAPALVRQIADHIAHTFLPSFATIEQLDIASVASLPPEINVTLTSALTGKSTHDAQQLLDEYANEGFGEFHPSGSEMSFRFHPLIAETLQRHASHTQSPAELCRLRRISADQLSHRGNGLGALKLYILADDYDNVWPTVSRHFSELINHQQDELHALLSTIPLSTLRYHGTAAISLAIVMSERERMPSVRLRQLVKMGVKHIDSLPIPECDRTALLLSLARFAGFRSARLYTDAAEQGDRFVAGIQKLSPEEFDITAPAIGAGLIQILITNILLGRWTAAIEVAHYLSPDDHPGRAQHRSSLIAYISAFRGDMTETRLQLDSVTFTPASGWRSSVPSTGWHLASTMRGIEAGNYVGALDAISALDARLGLLEHWPFALWTKSLLLLARGDAEQALQELNLALQLHEFRPLTDYARGLLSSMRSNLYLATGQRNQAERELERFAEGSTLVAPRLAQVRILLARGDLTAASAHLAATNARQQGTFREWSEALFLRSLIELREENTNEALAWARRGFEIMTRHELRTPLLMIPHDELRALIATGAPELEHHFEAIADPFGAALLESPLTPRECEVLTALARAASIDGVAKELFISTNTVKSQLRSIYRKLEVSSGAAAVRIAKQRGFIPR